MHEQLSATLPPNPVLGPADAPLPPLGRNLNVLMVWPRFPPSFWGFEGVLEMLPEAAMTPPLGLITVAALCPPSWNLRLIDRASRRFATKICCWADLVMISAMHAQRADARDSPRSRARPRPSHVHRRSLGQQRSRGVLAAAPTTSRRRSRRSLSPLSPAHSSRERRARLYRVAEKPDMTAQPDAALRSAALDKYTSMPVQFSRGCPFQCEFCDIITIYGRRPRDQDAGAAHRRTRHCCARSAGAMKSSSSTTTSSAISTRRSPLSRELAEWQEQHDIPSRSTPKPRSTSRTSPS